MKISTLFITMVAFLPAAFADEDDTMCVPIAEGTKCSRPRDDSRIDRLDPIATLADCAAACSDAGDECAMYSYDAADSPSTFDNVCILCKADAALVVDGSSVDFVTYPSSCLHDMGMPSDSCAEQNRKCEYADGTYWHKHYL